MSKEFYARLAAIQENLNAPKNQYNSFGKYKYRSCEDILEGVKPLLNGLFLSISDEVVLIGDRYYVKATATITDGENSHTATALAREEESKKGMDSAQVSATLASIACGLKKNIYGHHFGAPHDAADFRRCVALVEQIPEIRDSFDKVAKRVPAFKGILNEWDSLVALLKSEMKTYGNKAPETYRRISELRKD